MEAKIIKNVSGKYDKVQIKFSESIKDSTVVGNNFSIVGVIFGASGSTSGNSFSTERSDGTIDTDTDDEYITITYSAKDSVTNVLYQQGNIADLVGNKLDNQSIVPVE